MVVAIGCSKDKYQTKPSLEIKEVNTSDVQVGQTFTVTLKYTDKEGDVAGAHIGVAKVTTNCALSNFIDTLKYSVSGDVPSTSNQKGEIDIIFPYIFVNPFCAFDDSAVFKFWITDGGGNRSDTATTGLIVIRKS